METYFQHLSSRQPSHQRQHRSVYRSAWPYIFVVMSIVSAIIIYSGRLPLS